jgi:beta-mannosidase
MVGEAGDVLATGKFLPDGPRRPAGGQLGLQAVLQPVDEQSWTLSVNTRRFAEFVSVDVPGFRPDDSWFHLEPGGSATIGLHPDGTGPATPKGQVRALNSDEVARISP